MITPSTSRLLLEEDKNNKTSVRLVNHYHELISRIAQLARGVYPKRDAWWRWFYSLFLDGEVKSREKIEAIHNHICIAMHFVPYRECYNQVVLFLLSIAQRFKKLKKGISFKKYIRMVLGWRVRNWMNKFLRDADITKQLALG